jgi:hypothetical protein
MTRIKEPFSCLSLTKIFVLFNPSLNLLGLLKCDTEYSSQKECKSVISERHYTDVILFLLPAFPAEDPMIEGILSAYSIGDYVTANCTSGKSNPSAVLAWQINGLKVCIYPFERSFILASSFIILLNRQFRYVYSFHTYEICGFHGGENVDCELTGCDAVYKTTESQPIRPQSKFYNIAEERVGPNANSKKMGLFWILISVLTGN